MNVMLFGAEADSLLPEIDKHAGLTVVETDPEVVVCYGGDGTLLSAEQKWPGIPKVPIRNSRRGIRCIAHPPQDVIAHLVDGKLVRTKYMKLSCEVWTHGDKAAAHVLAAMNEVNVHMAHINSAVRFRLWINDEDVADGDEIVGDGFVISTPFGSTAYFHQITRGVFHAGLGIAFKNTAWHTDHFVVPSDATAKVLITRGPAVLAFDNSTQYHDLAEGDRLVVKQHQQAAVLLTWQPMSHPSDAF